MDRCIFLDRDGVLNEEIGTYVYRPGDLVIPAGVPEALQTLKRAGYLLVVITNQGGIAKGLYTKKEVHQCHEIIQSSCGGILDALYFCPYHPDYDSQSLARKPHSLMLEKAVARFSIDTTQSWMIGDRSRDLEAAHRLRVKGIFIGSKEEKAPPYAQFTAGNLAEAAAFILKA